MVSRLKTHCDAGNMARTFTAEEDELPFIRALFLLTRKPILYVANVDENEITHDKRNTHVQDLFDFAKKRKQPCHQIMWED